MGKRSNFEKFPHDKYDTPYEAVVPLLPFLPRACYYVEPCAGRGCLIDHLAKHGHTCISASDIRPERADIRRASVFALRARGKPLFITNPPWTRSILHPLIEHLAVQGPTWLLFQADWAHTSQATPYLQKYGRKIVSVGRVRWIENSGMDGKENAAWYLFDGTRPPSFIQFHERAA